jgi:hypothetical protein
MWLRLKSKKDGVTVIRVNMDAVEHFSPDEEGGTFLYMTGDPDSHLSVYESVREIEAHLQFGGRLVLGKS